MKIFFAIAVLAALIYLAFPKLINEKINQLLPQRKIELTATRLLIKIDQKLNKIKLELAEKQDQRINALEGQLTQLQQQLASNQQSYNNLLAKSGPRVNQQEIELPLKRDDRDNFSVSEQPNLAIPPLAPAQIQADNSLTADKLNIKRQAVLKDIAERMNQASLLTAFNN